MVLVGAGRSPKRREESGVARGRDASGGPKRRNEPFSTTPAQSEGEPYDETRTIKAKGGKRATRGDLGEKKER